MGLVFNFRTQEVVYTRCGNYGNILSHYFDKNFVKATFLLKQLLKSWFHKTFFREFLVFPHCDTLAWNWRPPTQFMDLLTKSSLKFAMITLRFLFAIGSDVREILSDLRNTNQQFQELTDFAEIQNSKFEGLKYCANKWNSFAVEIIRKYFKIWKKSDFIFILNLSNPTTKMFPLHSCIFFVVPLHHFFLKVDFF